MKKNIFIFILSCAFLLNAQDIDNIQNLITKVSNTKGKKKAKLLIDISKAYGFSSFRLSEEYAKQAEKISLDLELDTLLINIYRIIGASKQYQDQKDSAIFYFNKSVEYSKKIRSKTEIAKSYSNIAIIYASDKQFDKAEEIYFNSLEILKEANNTVAISQIYNNLGMIYRLKNNYDKSLEFYNKAIALTDTNTVDYAIKLSNIAEIYFLSNNNTSAIDLYLKSIKIFESKESKYNIAFTYKRIADLYFNDNKIEKAKLYCMQSISVSKEVDAKDILLHSYNLMIAIEKKQRNFESALRYYNLYTKLNEDINETKRNKLLNELKTKYDVEIKDTQLKQQELQINNKNRFLLILSITIAFLFILVILLILQIKKINIAYKNIAEKNMEAVTVEEELVELKQHIIINKDTNEEKQLIDKIIEYVVNKKPYLDPELTIFKFADDLQTNKTYVSQEINNRFNKNFSNFINDYRVAEARRLMTMSEYYNLTLAAIAEKAGFNSVSVFNRSFKRVTGITPSFYLKTVKQR